MKLLNVELYFRLPQMR